MVCLVPIPPGARYHFYASRWDDSWTAFKHCARCWFLYLAADVYTEGEAALLLNCDEPWEEPPESVAALAFLSANEAQALIDREADFRTELWIDLRAPRSYTRLRTSEGNAGRGTEFLTVGPTGFRRRS